MSQSKLKIVIFDMDGLLVDTERVYRDGWQYATKQHGVDLPEHMFQGWVGKGYHETTNALVELTNDPQLVQEIRKTRENYFYQELEAGRVEAKPYAKEALQAAKENYTVALATSTMGERARNVLETLGFLQYIDHPVFGDEVEKLKPAPDLYLEALRRAGFSAGEGVAVEDSITGSQAAENAGLPVLMVPDSNFELDVEKVPAGVVKRGKDLRIVLEYLEKH
ncbi:HAD family phosphatase [Enterococcus sp. 669A]|uniref:HAD family phosphatase n=1 Tax=Candidatus Enterococcus moelleringii TaxID=2815325 RepID=A0ABS3L9R5_9ENTE|nr:HAD family phosphatase [Enterococcus sp. 669A]MBO1305179.1 HAD family phosphatase [Enterococcus sp. 669A]